MSIKKRYSVVPQMEYYDQITCDYKPFVMFFNRANFTSKIVNSDNLGFRLYHFNNKLLKQSEFYNHDEISLVIGGSSVFGFGSTTDQNTISSKLTKKTNQVFLNYGATAFNSKQEIILFLNYFQKFKKIKNVIIISGVNDIYLNLINEHDEWGDFFFKKKFNEIQKFYENRRNYRFKIKRLIEKIFNKKKNNIVHQNINFSNLDKNFKELFSLWSSLSKNYNFKIDFYLQPLASWIEKPLSIEERNLFKILDNSNDFSHLVLKEISKIDNYAKYSNILQKNSKENNINFVDLNTQFKKINNLDESLFVDRVHLNDLGYEEISKIILNQF